MGIKTKEDSVLEFSSLSSDTHIDSISSLSSSMWLTLTVVNQSSLPKYLWPGFLLKMNHMRLADP